MARHAPLRSSRKEPSAAVDGAHPERPMPKFKGRATPRSSDMNRKPSVPDRLRTLTDAPPPPEA